MILWVSILGFVIKASLVSAGENNLVRVTSYGIAAHYDITVCIDLGAVDFHDRELVGFEVVINCPNFCHNIGFTSTHYD